MGGVLKVTANSPFLGVKIPKGSRNLSCYLCGLSLVGWGFLFYLSSLSAVSHHSLGKYMEF